MDITIDVEDYKLNIRAAGIIIHNNKILAHRNKNSDHHALLGGRVAIGENSEETVKREIYEETGKEVEIIGYISTIENFFEMRGKKYHEIMFVYKVEFTNEKDKLLQDTIKNIEGKEYLQYEWLDIDKIDQYPLRPQIVKEILKEKVFPVHKINDELDFFNQYLGKKVKVKIDRPLGSKHPKHGFEYLLNYGYIPNTVSGDGEELDCYILGIDYPLDTFEGKCIAIIHRTNDNDDKLIIVPENSEYTDEEIRKLTNFQEQYFNSKIIRKK